jgi:hypothetical protein
MILENTDDVTTQIYFLECLDEVMLNTLLQRVKNEILKDDIIKVINNDSEFNKPQSLIIETLIGSMKTSPSVYISFYENGNKICHVSIHLCPTTNEKNSKGPFHITNNSKNGKTRRMKIKRKNNSMIIEVGSLYMNKSDIINNNFNISYEAQKYTSYVIKVLNSYFNKKLPTYLGIKSSEHSYFRKIQKLKNNALSRLAKTRKNNIKKRDLMEGKN